MPVTLKDCERITNRRKTRLSNNGIYSPEMCEEVHNLALLGLSLNQIAGVIGVDDKTISVWMRTYPEFAAAITEGRDVADGEVVRSLWERATGSKVIEQHVFYDEKRGTTIIEQTIKEYPPESGACMQWLKNRQPKLWRDRQHDALTEDGININIIELKGKEQS